MIVVGMNGDTGPQDFQNSYRYEAHALLAAFIFIHEFQKVHGIPPNQ